MKSLTRLLRLWPLLLFSVATAAPPVAIVGARVEIGTGAVLDRATIIIRDGKITEVSATATVPEGATVVDGKGLTAYPGFIDAYTTRGVTTPAAPALGTPPDSRTTAPPFMWEGNRAGIRAGLEAFSLAKFDGEPGDSLKQGLVAALLVPPNGVVRGQASVVGYSEKPAVIKAAVAQSISYRGAAAGAVGTGYPGSLLGIIALVRQTLWDAKTYQGRLDAGQTPPKDEINESLRAVVGGRQPILFEADSEREIDRAFLLADEFNVGIILRGAREAARRGDEIAKRKWPVILRIDWPEAPPLKNTENRAEPIPEAILQERYNDWKDRLQNPRRLVEAGIKFAFCTEGGIGDYLNNIRTAIKEGGLNRADALRAMTTDAAEILGVSDRLGLLAPGQDACIVLMNGDFANSETKVMTVFAFGNRIDVTPKEAAK